jgi:hypothetical protein
MLLTALGTLVATVYLNSYDVPPVKLMIGIGHPLASSGVNVKYFPKKPFIVQPVLPAGVRKLTDPGPPVAMAPRGATSAPLTTSAVVKKNRFKLNIIVLRFTC